MIKDIAIKNIMTHEVHHVNEEEPLVKVLSIFRRNKIRHLPVVKDGKITGIISRTDINRLTFGALFEGQENVDEAVLDLLSIPQVMTAKPRAISPDTSISEVAKIFVKEDFHALPVVENDALKGIVTTTDIIRYYSENNR